VNVLLASDVAEQWIRTESWRSYSSGAELVELVDSYLVTKGLSGSKISRVEIASEILRLRAQAAEQQPTIASPEQAQWQSNLREGTTADDAALAQMDEIALSQRVRATSLADWGQERIRLGIAPKSTLDHLAGSFNN
jgi:hypothetical protein